MSLTAARRFGLPATIGILGLVFLGALIALFVVSRAAETRARQFLAASDAASAQGTLVEKMAISLFELQGAKNSKSSTLKPLADFTSEQATFERTLGALNGRGETSSANGESVSYNALGAVGVNGIAKTIDDGWNPLLPLFDSLFAESIAARTIDDSVRSYIAVEPSLVDSSNQIVKLVSNASDDYQAGIGRQRTLLSIVAALAFVSLLVTLAATQTGANVARRRAAIIEQQANDLEAQQRNTSLIMETVTQGLLLIDGDRRILPQFSARLTTILETDDLAGRDIEAILEPLLSAKTQATMSKFLKMLFDPKKSERAILQVNPLSDIEVSMPRPNAKPETKYLSFAFRRLVKDRKITQVFVSVSDVTERTLFEKNLRELDKRKERQLATLLDILNVDQDVLDEFISLIKREITKINSLLNARDFTSDQSNVQRIHEQLNSAYRSIHNVKGNAAYLGLSQVESEATTFEDQLSALRKLTTYNGEEYVLIATAFAEVMKMVEELETMREKLRSTSSRGSVNAEPSQPALEPSQPHVDRLERDVSNFIEVLAQKTGKPAGVTFNGFNISHLDNERRSIVRDVIIQLARNSLAHGIEPAAERAAAGKPPAGAISISRHQTDASAFGFVYRDDGRGLDVERISRRATELGLIDSQKIDSGDPARLASMIFAPGFSTADSVTAEAGRGVGMDLIRKAIIDDLGGRIRVEFVAGSYCAFHIEFPIQSAKSGELVAVGAHA